MNQPLPNAIAALAPELLDWRRTIHRHPELGYEETRTAALVAEKLRSFGVDRLETGMGGTGVVATIHGQDGPGADESEMILLRADMDALPIQEATGLDYASEIDGKMHACGHDGHTTMLLGAAKQLAETRNFKGSVHLVFQPAEEGGAGAQAMIEDGLFDNFPCRAVFGMHNWPTMPVGVFAVRSGPALAAANQFDIRLKGRGGHAAKPDSARDPIVAGAQLISMAQSIISRRLDPMQAAVLSFTTFHAGSTHNVIPETAELSGTIRCFDEAAHTEICRLLEKMVHDLADAHGMSASVRFGDKGYPPTINDPEATEIARIAAEAVVGPENMQPSHPPTMGAEDFAFLARVKPGCFVITGNGDSASLHHPEYDFNDDAAPYGVAYWVKLVETALPRNAA